jgi:hypothetical protein
MFKKIESYNKIFYLTLISIIAILFIIVITTKYDNYQYIMKEKELCSEMSDLIQENEELQNKITYLETELHNGNQALIEYEEKLLNYEKYKIKSLGYGSDWGARKSYMSYKAITSTGSKQYQLQQIATTDPETGIRMIDGDYCVAIGTGWGCVVGDKILVTLQNGKSFNAIMADAKANAHTQGDNKTSMDGSVVEFVVEISSLPKEVRISGSLGSLEQFEGGVLSITKR